MKNRANGDIQIVAAAKAGFCERSGRDIEHGKQRKEHNWKTRPDPFDSVWSEVVHLLERGVKRAIFILEELQKRYPGQYSLATLRTLQRRVNHWKALNVDKEVMFMQAHEPGILGLSDFTQPKDIKVTLNRKPLDHIYYHFRLPWSGFSYITVFEGSGEAYRQKRQLIASKKRSDRRRRGLCHRKKKR
jgi:hypothetical protein